MKEEPSPEPLSGSILPPWAAAICRATEGPGPVPPVERGISVQDHRLRPEPRRGRQTLVAVAGEADLRAAML